jgi:hypothetical protein
MNFYGSLYYRLKRGQGDIVLQEEFLYTLCSPAAGVQHVQNLGQQAVGNPNEPRKRPDHFQSLAFLHPPCAMTAWAMVIIWSSSPTGSS